MTVLNADRNAITILKISKSIKGQLSMDVNEAYDLRSLLGSQNKINPLELRSCCRVGANIMLAQVFGSESVWRKWRRVASLQ